MQNAVRNGRRGILILISSGGKESIELLWYKHCPLAYFMTYVFFEYCFW